MNCIDTPNNLDVLLHYHVSPRRHPNFCAPSVGEAISILLNAGLIESNDGHYKTTYKGKFYIEHLLAQPFPETKFIIPESIS